LAEELRQKLGNFGIVRSNSMEQLTRSFLEDGDDLDNLADFLAD